MKINEEKFIDIFKHSPNAYLKDGKVTIRGKITRELVVKHLNGEQRLGIFPIIDKRFSHLFVIDIDVNDFSLAKKILEETESHDLHCYLEKSKGKGFHIWAFFKERVENRELRICMRHIIKSCNAEKVKIDIFPRQDNIEDDGLGNAINLPLFGVNGQKELTGTYFFDPTFLNICDQLDILNTIKSNNAKPLEKIISKLGSTEDGSHLHIRNNPIISTQNLSHEAETLNKLVAVCKRTKKLRDDCFKNSKNDRSLADTIYAKHLAELLFSQDFIELEIKGVSRKYNDPKLKGKAREKYLLDKKNQLAHINELFKPTTKARNTTSKAAHFDHLSEEESSPLIPRIIRHNRYDKIEEELLNWLEFDFYRVIKGESICLNAKCGGGKSNLIKQLALTFWNYNKVQVKKDNKSILVAVERIQDGLRLERTIQALTPKKLLQNSNFLGKNDLIPRSTLEKIDKFIEKINSAETSIKDLIETNIQFITQNGKLDIHETPIQNNKSIVFKCSSSPKVCLEGYDEAKLQNNICVACTQVSCPSNPKRSELIQSSKIGIITHQALVQPDSSANLLLDSNNRFRSLLLIDERPDILRTYTFVLSKETNHYKSSIDDLMNYLVNVKDSFSLLKELTESVLTPLKERFAKTRKTFDEMNKTAQKNDIYKENEIPNLSFGGRKSLEKLKDEIKSEVKTISEKRRLLEEIELIQKFEGKSAIAVFGMRNNRPYLSFHTIINSWDKICQNKITSTIILDATANIDPAYLLSNAPTIKRFFEDSGLSFPNLHLRFFDDRDIHKGNVDNKFIDRIYAQLLSEHNESSKLIVTSKDLSPSLEKSKLSKLRSCSVDHYNNLKGKNDYIDCDVILFTNMLRRNEMDYLLIANEISKSKKIDGYQLRLPKNWEFKRGKDGLTNKFDSTIKFNDSFIDSVRTNVDLVELVQTIFRVSLRRDNSSKAYVYLPISSSGLIKKLIHYFKDSRVERLTF